MFDLTKREQIIIGTALVLIIALVGIIMINYQKTNDDEIQISAKNEVSAMPTHNQESTIPIENNIIKKIAVHVKGQVKNPGLVYLEEGKRVNDAVEAAGGVLETADLDAINLAAYIEDGQEVYVPAKGETEKLAENAFRSNSQIQAATSTKPNSASKKVNINTADAKELETLPGIGAAIAQRIIDYRNQHGKFSTIEEIQNVSGIGSSRFNQIKDLIDVR